MSKPCALCTFRSSKQLNVVSCSNSFLPGTDYPNSIGDYVILIVQMVNASWDKNPRNLMRIPDTAKKVFCPETAGLSMGGFADGRIQWGLSTLSPKVNLLYTLY